MKKFLLGAFLLSFAFLANAQSQTFKPFKFDFALGYAIPSGSGSKGGVIIAGEPKYAINDNITVGLRGEAALTARGYVDANGDKVSGSVKASASYLLTGDYYFNTNAFRPFAGVGLGMFSTAGESVTVTSTSGGTTSTTTATVEASSNFGFMPRVGFEYGHFRMALEYNFAGKTGSINNNYMGIKLGFFAGGGRRK